MKNFTNIEKSGFRKGEYVGYANGDLFFIRKSTSSFGNWQAQSRENPSHYIYAFTLEKMSEKLSAIKQTA